MIIKYIENLQEAYRKTVYMRGYSFAINSYLHHDTPTTQISLWSEIARDFGNYDAFDEGIEQAIKDLYTLGLVSHA